MTDSLHVVCPACLAVNRLPAQKLAEGPGCGRCHEPLFTGHPIPLNQGSFKRHVERNDIPIVVDFWAPWCGPCKAMAPEFERAAQELEPAVRLAKLDTQAEPGLGNEYGIRGIPTIVLFERGAEVARRSGAIGAAEIVRWVTATRAAA
jgi:thioredoxin 2